MQIFAELRRRNVFRVAVAYLVSAWLIIQVVETVFPPFGFGDAAIRAVVVMLGIGLLPVLVISWVFELTPEGLKLEKDVDRAESVTWRTGRKLDRAIVAVLVLAVAYFAIDKFVFDPARDAEQLQNARQAARSEAIIASVGNRSIAVLPFVDLSPASDQSYFSEGIAEELLNLLATIPEVRVTSRSSAFALKGKGLSVPEIAEQLRVSYVLDGSVRKAGDQVRISAQLIDAQSDTQLWARNFDRTLQNIFQIQDEIAGDVVNQIKGTLNIASPAQRQTDPVAYALFLQAREQRRLGTVDSYDRAIELYQSVLEIDPNYPPAWDEMASAYQSQAVTGLRPATEGFRLAREAALAAIDADPSYAQAYGTLAFMSQYYDADLAAATRYLQRALELAPGDSALIGSAGMLLQNMGRAQEGLGPIEYKVDLDPLSAAWQYTLGIAYISAGRFEDAVRAFETTIGLSPDFSLAHYNLGIAHMLAGRPAEAATILLEEPREDWRLAGLAMAYFERDRHKPGNAQESTASDLALAELLEKYSGNMTYNIGYVYAYRDDADDAFEWLELAVEVGDAGLGEILSQPLFENIHDDPRWLPFLRKLGRSPDQLSGIELSVTLPE
ncbi:MAG: tetratricopeptide repeat protein [Gammaproteobacteria bacterium]|nr:tetratricopeptide repeat protein [Gammaproteobacteria bacterium]MBT8105153.1 tetratricopeptide repeat protein [Gammaproteobacteria bacterium]NNK25167.1 tetratricopeptide repeat protein [Woeseiaceae bacterium]